VDGRGPKRPIVKHKTLGQVLGKMTMNGSPGWGREERQHYGCSMEREGNVEAIDSPVVHEERGDGYGDNRPSFGGFWKGGTRSAAPVFIRLKGTFHNRAGREKNSSSFARFSQVREGWKVETLTTTSRRKRRRRGNPVS